MSDFLLQQMVAGRAPAPVSFSVDQLHRMLELGILPDGEPVELLDGILVKEERGGGGSLVHGASHALAVTLLARFDRLLDPRRCHLRSQLPLTLSARDEPEPDAAVVLGPPTRYAREHPGPSQTTLVVEVADSSLEHDRTTKQRLYAASQIPHYWIVNLRDHQLETFRDPVSTKSTYASGRIYKPGEDVMVDLEGMALKISVDEILPPSP